MFGVRNFKVTKISVTEFDYFLCSKTVSLRASEECRLYYFYYFFFQTELYSRHPAFCSSFILLIVWHANNSGTFQWRGCSEDMTCGVCVCVCGMFCDADYSVSRILLYSLGNNQWASCSSYVVCSCFAPCLLHTQLLFLYWQYKVNDVKFIDYRIFTYNLFTWNLITCTNIRNFLIN